MKLGGSQEADADVDPVKERRWRPRWRWNRGAGEGGHFTVDSHHEVCRTSWRVGYGVWEKKRLTDQKDELLIPYSFIFHDTHQGQGKHPSLGCWAFWPNKMTVCLVLVPPITRWETGHMKDPLCSSVSWLRIKDGHFCSPYCKRSRWTKLEFRQLRFRDDYFRR